MSETGSTRTILSGCSNTSVNIECSYHRNLTARTVTPKYFINGTTIMVDGLGYRWTTSKEAYYQMPNPNGGTYASGVGHSGNEYAKIILKD